MNSTASVCLLAFVFIFPQGKAKDNVEQNESMIKVSLTSVRLELNLALGGLQASCLENTTD